MCLLSVRIEPGSLLHNYSDYKNLKAGVVGICMRTGHSPHYFHLYIYSIRLSKRERSFTVFTVFPGKD